MQQSLIENTFWRVSVLADYICNIRGLFSRYEIPFSLQPIHFEESGWRVSGENKCRVPFEPCCLG